MLILRDSCVRRNREKQFNIEDLKQARSIRVRRECPRFCYNEHTYCLTQNELARLQKYEQYWLKRYGHPGSQNPNAIYHLGDNPDEFVCCSTAKGAFPSLRASMGVLFHPASSTIITNKEKLAIIGWPVFEVTAAAVGIHSFEFPDLQRAGKYAGNAYHVAVMGAFMASALACVCLDDNFA